MILVLLAGCGDAGEPGGSSANAPDGGDRTGAIGTLPARKPDYGHCGSDGWCRYDLPTNATGLTAVWGASNGEMFACGGSTLMHWDGTSWSSTSIVAGELSTVWGSGPNDVSALGSMPAGYGHYSAVGEHWNGSGWGNSPYSYTPVSFPMAMWGSRADDYWIVGEFDNYTPAVMHSTANPVGNVPLDFHPLAVWGSSADDVWIAGDNNSGIILHWDGRSLNTLAGPSARGIWGSGPNDVWAVGAGIWHWDGTTWSAMAGVSPTLSLNGISGAAANDVWAVGGGIMLHWNGTAWTPVTIPSGVNPTAIWVNASDVWAVGGGILHLRRSN